MWEKIKNFWKSDNLLDEAWNDSFEMIKICQEMFIEATKALREKIDTTLDEKIKKQDKIVNKYEREVRKKVMTHLSIQAPKGLPEGMVLVSIVIDIERLGDYTKNIAELASKYKKTLKAGKLESDLKKVEEAVTDNYKKTVECIGTSDQASAIELMNKYKWVNPLCDNSLTKLISEEDKKITAGQSAALTLYFRWLKRINSHLRNITSSVVNPFHRIGFKVKKKNESLV